MKMEKKEAIAHYLVHVAEVAMILFLIGIVMCIL